MQYICAICEQYKPKLHKESTTPSAAFSLPLKYFKISNKIDSRRRFANRYQSTARPTDADLAIIILSPYEIKNQHIVKREKIDISRLSGDEDACIRLCLTGAGMSQYTNLATCGQIAIRRTRNASTGI